MSHLRQVWTLVPLVEGKECLCWLEVNIEFLMVVIVTFVVSDGFYLTFCEHL